VVSLLAVHRHVVTVSVRVVRTRPSGPATNIEPGRAGLAVPPPVELPRSPVPAEFHAGRAACPSRRIASRRTRGSRASAGLPGGGSNPQRQCHGTRTCCPIPPAIAAPGPGHAPRAVSAAGRGPPGDTARSRMARPAACRGTRPLSAALIVRTRPP
jgi:hypothetical protein